MKCVGTLEPRESDMKICLMSLLKLYYLQVKLHSSFTQHDGKKEGSGEWRLALDILVHLHLLLCVAVFSAAFTQVWIRP